jgi:hypothetical protein
VACALPVFLPYRAPYPGGKRDLKVSGVPETALSQNGYMHGKMPHANEGRLQIDKNTKLSVATQRSQLSGVNAQPETAPKVQGWRLMYLLRWNAVPSTGLQGIKRRRLSLTSGASRELIRSSRGRVAVCTPTLPGGGIDSSSKHQYGVSRPASVHAGPTRTVTNRPAPLLGPSCLASGQDRGKKPLDRWHFFLLAVETTERILELNLPLNSESGILASISSPRGPVCVET